MSDTFWTGLGDDQLTSFHNLHRGLCVSLKQTPIALVHVRVSHCYYWTVITYQNWYETVLNVLMLTTGLIEVFHHFSHSVAFKHGQRFSTVSCHNPCRIILESGIIYLPSQLLVLLSSMAAAASSLLLWTVQRCLRGTETPGTSFWGIFGIYWIVDKLKYPLQYHCLHWSLTHSHNCGNCCEHLISAPNYFSSQNLP